MKSAFITGASEGIGRAMAKKWLAEGFHVFGVARNEERLRELKREYAASFDFIVADLAKDVGLVANLIESKPYDVLINNAGFGHYADFIDQPLSILNNMIDVNIKAVVTLSHSYLQKARTGDALMNVSSLLSFFPMPAGTVYSATKAFVTSFSEGLWQQNKKRDVFVTALCPGATESEFFSRANHMHAEKPPTRMTQTAEEVANISWEAMKARNSPVIICGRQNKSFVAASKLLPRKKLLSLMDNMRKEKAR